MHLGDPELAATAGAHYISEDLFAGLAAGPFVFVDPNSYLGDHHGNQHFPGASDVGEDYAIADIEPRSSRLIQRHH